MLTRSRCLWALTGLASLVLVAAAVSRAPSAPSFSYGFAAKEAQRIYVTNYNDSTVKTYTAAGTRTTPTITGLSALGSLTVNSAGKIYVAHGGSDGVTTYTSNGTRTTPTIPNTAAPDMSRWTRRERSTSPTITTL